MKKYLIAFLLSLSCAFTLAAVGCTNDPAESSSPDTGVESTDSSSSEEENEEPEYTGSYVVTFEEGEGFTYKTDVVSGEEVDGGDYVEFEISRGGFYQDSSPVVYVNDKAVAHNNGKYKIQVTDKALNIRVEGVKKDVSTLNLTGTGAMDAPFVVSKPIDLVYMADKVNAGEQAYVQGAYILANDIDCNGAELKVIGDGSTPNSYFSGCFTCDYTEDGTLRDYKISNFVINSQNSNNVGLFGQVYSDFSVTSSALFYGIRLDNFTIEAGLYDHYGDNKSICAGGLIGYGVGANLYLCEATNGAINVTADSNYFSFAGGLIGYQQAYYDPNYGQYFASEIAYATVDVDVTVLGAGMALYAGGISGYMATNYPLVSTASVHNSYATGDVAGALNCGGIAGGLGQYSVVSNCYATGSIFATSHQNASAGTATSDDYYKAHAGGLVGFAENDAIVHDSFFNGDVAATAVSGNGYAFTDMTLGGSYDDGYVSATSKKAQVINCKANVATSNTSFFTEVLGWGAYDWNFKANSLPTINYSTYEGVVQLSMNIHYVAPNKSGDDKSVVYREMTSSKMNYFDSSIQSNSSYATFGAYLAGGDLPYYCATDDGTMRSFGYFFDPECTQPVPYAYMPMKNVDLYIGFEDVSAILGTYYFTSDTLGALEITFTADGLVRYSDGVTEQEAYYTYDNNHQIMIDGARLARYYDGEIVLDETNTSAIQDANFDLYRYMYYNFVGKVENGVLSLYDGVYFTESDPFTASATKPNVETYDAFKGEWTKSANVNKVYSFDGKGNWTYSYVSYTRDGNNFTTSTIKSANGTYEVIDTNHIKFVDNGVTYNAIINADGVLEITDGVSTAQQFYRGASYLGKWTTNGMSLELFGIQADGTGLAKVTYSDGYVIDLVYEATETNGYIALYVPHADYWKNDIYGYLTYNVRTHTLSVTISDYYGTTETGYAVYTLRAIDEYCGEWITEDGEFVFDGNGLYAHQNQKGYVVVTIGDKTQRVEYTLDSTLNGRFVFDSVTYTFSYNEDDKTITLTGNATEDLMRKDEFANIVFVDLYSDTEYVFDGRSTLASGGTLTIDGNQSYTYKAGANGYDIYDNGTAVGTLTKENNHYALTIDGNSTALYMSNDFMGDWVMSGLFSTFKIGPTDLNGDIRATFKGQSVVMTYLDSTVLTFNYREGNMPYTYYVFIIDDAAYNNKVLVITEYPNLYGDDQIFCTEANVLYGTWVWNKDSNMSIKFDGVSCSYVFGTASMVWGTYVTPYNFRVTEKGMMMYSQEALGENYLYFNLKLLFPGDEGYDAAKADRNNWYNAQNQSVLIRTEADSLCLTEAKDEDGNEYYFDGLGSIFCDGEIVFVYEYKNVTYNGDRTATIIAKGADGLDYSLFLNYKDASAYKLEINEIEATEDNA